MARRSRRRRVSSSEEESDSSSEESDSDSVSSLSDLSGLSSSDSDSASEPSDDSNSEFDENDFPGENKRKTEEEVRELIRDAKVMKYENAIIEDAGIDNYESMKNCDERTLKKLKMGYSDRERLLKVFRNHLSVIVEKNRERWERKKELKHSSRRKKAKGKKSTKRGQSKSSKSKSRKKSGSSKSSSSRKKKPASKSRSKGRKKIDEDEALRNIDCSWSGKKQAWADYKSHEAKVAELVEFYDEIGKKRTNAEEHARKLLVSYPGGIHKLVIALDKKYHHIPYGWEPLLEEALRAQEFEKSESD